MGDLGGYEQLDSVTLVVTQRERFSCTAQSLASLYDTKQVPFRCIYVDGGSPPDVRDWLNNQRGRRGFELVRVDHYLTQNEARNLVLPAITTPYACFVDNDVVAFPGWLEALIRCAEQTGASIVGPRYLIHTRREGHRVHASTGLYEVQERRGRRTCTYKSSHEGRSLDDPDLPRERQPCEHVEFHCMLVRTELLRRLSGFDEGILASFDHVDLCLSALERGASIWSEPAASVSYLEPPPFAPSDLPFFMLHWSEAWDAASRRCFDEKWGTSWTYPHRTWVRKHRSLWYDPVPTALSRLIGQPAAHRMLAATLYVTH